MEKKMSYWDMWENHEEPDARPEYDEAKAKYIETSTSDGETHTPDDERIALDEWVRLHDALKVLNHKDVAAFLGVDDYLEFVYQLKLFAHDKFMSGYMLREKQEIEAQKLGGGSRTYNEMTVNDFVTTYNPTVVDGKIKIELWRTNNFAQLRKYVERHRDDIMRIIA